MKLAHFNWSSPIDFHEGKINTLVIENPKLFRDTVIAFIEQGHGVSQGYILSDKNDVLDFGKSVELITDIVRLSFDSRSFTAKINQIVNDESKMFEDKSKEILSAINKLANDILFRLDFDGTFTELNDLSGVLKLLNFSVDAENMTPYERILEYMNLQTLFFHKKLFVLVNFKSYFTLEEQRAFLKHLQYKKLDVLLLESTCQERISSDEQLRIIDNDLCEI